MSTITKFITGLTGILLVSLCFPAQSRAASFFVAEKNGESVAVTAPVTGDAFVAGSTTTVNAPVSGELFAAGKTVSVTEPSGRSIFAAGMNVNINRGAAYNAFLAGNSVVLSGTFGNDVYVAGSSVTITEGTVITGSLHVAAATLTLAGSVGGDAFLAVDSLTSSAAVAGSVKGWGNNFTFTGGSIGGDFTYQSRKEAAGLDRVSITGQTQRTDPPARATGPMPWREMWFGIVLWKYIGMWVLGAALLLLMRRRVARATQILRNNWTTAFTRGLVAFILVPVAAIVALALVVGWQVAMVLFLLYVLLLSLANVLGTIFVGSLILERLNQRPSQWWSLLVGVITLVILVSLPYLGWIAGLAYFFGALVPALGVLAWEVARDTDRDTDQDTDGEIDRDADREIEEESSRGMGSQADRRRVRDTRRR
jgi:hypothetical protein